MPNNRTKRFLAAVAVALVAVGATWVVFRSVMAPPPVAAADRGRVDKAVHSMAVNDIAADLNVERASRDSMTASIGPAAGVVEPAAPREDEGDDDWRALQARADAGNARAACRLSLKLEACREAAAERSQIERDIAHAAHEAGTTEETLASIARSEERTAGNEARCGGAPESLVRRDWEYLLDAALEGHGPSMYRFVIYPPIDTARSLDYVDALIAYRQHARAFTDELLRRGSAEGMVAALLIAAGISIVGDAPLQAPDPEERLRMAAALSILRGKPAVLDSAIDGVADTLSPQEIQRAIDAGRASAQRFTFQFSTIGNGIEVDRDPQSCDAHWAE